MVDPRLHPVAYLSVNGRSTAEVPQGWPMVIRAAVFGGRDEPITFSPDDVTLRVTDQNGAAVNWPMKRAILGATSQPATGPVVTIMANDKSAGHVGWVVDSKSIVTGGYHVEAKLKGVAYRGVEVTVVPAPAQMNEQQQATKFLAEGGAAIMSGDGDGALRQADERLKAKPTDLPALHLRADALAALGRKDEAIVAYGKALKQLYAENPKAPEPPTMLLRGLRDVSGGN
jgi:hypothetical protein